MTTVSTLCVHLQEMASFKIAALQKALELSVPAADLEQANKQYTELTERYRDLLEKSNTLVSETEQNSGFEACVHCTTAVIQTHVNACLKTRVSKGRVVGFVCRWR